MGSFTDKEDYVVSVSAITSLDTRITTLESSVLTRTGMETLLFDRVGTLEAENITLENRVLELEMALANMDQRIAERVQQIIQATF